MSENYVERQDIPGLADRLSARLKMGHPEYDFTKFEDSFIFAASVFMPKQNMLELFKVDKPYMDWMCKKVFDGFNFDSAYAYFQNCSRLECNDMFVEFAKEGNTFPQQLVAKFFLGMKDDSEENAKNVNIKVIGAIPQEDK